MNIRKRYYVKAVDLMCGLGFDRGHRTLTAAQKAAEQERLAWPSAHIEVVTRAEKEARLAE